MVLFTLNEESTDRLGEQPSTNCFFGGDVMMVGEQGRATLFYWELHARKPATADKQRIKMVSVMARLGWQRHHYVTEHAHGKR